MSQRTLSHETPLKIGETVTVAGWIHAVRDHSKVLFIDLRDRGGLLQVVTGKWSPESFAVLQTAGIEDVVEITGTVAARPEKLVNPNIASGTVELQAAQARILGKSQVPPFEINVDTSNVDEELRLKYRYLDLRSERMAATVRARARQFRFIREFLNERDFTEVETPLLTASTPEGARDYLVPTRLGNGQFYALPQSPQQYKQLLMVAGMERYFQIAKCLRDEDSRGDRQPEHTQLDLEMSFVTQEDLLNLIEELYTAMVRELYPEKRISQSPWPRLTYAESMEKYGNDKPDLRVDKDDPDELAFCFITDFPLFEYNDKEKRIEPMHHMFTMPRLDHVELLDTDPLKVIGQLYDVACNGYELGSGSLRIVDRSIQEKVFSIIGITKEEAERKFGHMLEAFSYGAPPHGGWGLGQDRFLMILRGEPNIREVIPFPKTGEGRDPLMGAPAAVAEGQLKELGIAVTK